MAIVYISLIVSDSDGSFKLLEKPTVYSIPGHYTLLGYSCSGYDREYRLLGSPWVLYCYCENRKEVTRTVYVCFVGVLYSCFKV